MYSDADLTRRRQRWMSVLARATADELAAGLPDLPAYTRLRGPEAGLVMLRGRAGGAGNPFNLGEATVVRCTVRTPSGTVGHAYCLGRDLRQAELAAVLDALLQDAETGPALETGVVAPLAEAQAARRALLARRAAATQVQFFTLATMRS
ncbi:MAG TPA: phosphonate C-P lyase system protein PhnG [Acetobacteraceae bacterium]